MAVWKTPDKRITNAWQAHGKRINDPSKPSRKVYSHKVAGFRAFLF